MNQQQTTPTLAQGQQITEEQQRDAYHWGRQGAARTFDWRGE